MIKKKTNIKNIDIEATVQTALDYSETISPEEFIEVSNTLDLKTMSLQRNHTLVLLEGIDLIMYSQKEPLDFYINSNDECVDIEPQGEPCFQITRYNTFTGTKTVYKVVKDEVEVPYNPEELGTLKRYYDRHFAGY